MEILRSDIRPRVRERRCLKSLSRPPWAVMGRRVIPRSRPHDSVGWHALMGAVRAHCATDALVWALRGTPSWPSRPRHVRLGDHPSARTTS